MIDLCSSTRQSLLMATDTNTFAALWAVTRDAQGSARADAATVLADFCESVGDGGMAASARGWAKNPNGAYIPYSPWSLSTR